MDNKWERFFGLTLNINPLFNIIGLIGLSIDRRKNFKFIKSDRVNLYFWAALALSGLISIIGAYDKQVAVTSFFIPFVFIWLYILGRWYIKNPVRFLTDMIRGTAWLGLLTIIFNIFEINLVINGFKIIAKFPGRGYILGIGDNGLGILLQSGIVGALGLLVLADKRRHILYNLFYFFLCLGGLMITRSRGAFVGTTAGVIFLTLVFSWKIVALFAGVSGLFMVFSEQLQERVKSIFSLYDDRSNYIRIKIYEGVWDMIKDHFWFGAGPGNFNQIYEKYRLPAENAHAVSPHSNYLNIISGWGIVGGFIFFGWCFYIMIRSWLRGAGKYQKIILAVLITFWVHIAVNDLFVAYAGVMLGCLDNSYFKKSVE